MILVTTPGNVGHHATRLLADDHQAVRLLARNLDKGRRVAGLAFSPATGISPLQSASLPCVVRGFWEMCSTCNCKSLEDCALYDDRYTRLSDDRDSATPPRLVVFTSRSRGGPGP